MGEHYNSVSSPIRTFVVVFTLMIVSVSAPCDEGFFDNSNDCVKCPENCAYCNSSDFCFSCHTGYSGNKCQHFCANCQPGSDCVKDNGLCLESCKNGLSGTYCNNTCDSRCEACYRNNTTKCLTCKKNLTCESICPEDCLLQECEENHCKTVCLPGYWEDNCEYSCPRNCSMGKSSTELYIVIVPSTSLVSMFIIGLVLCVVIRKRWKSRHRENHVIVYHTMKMI